MWTVAFLWGVALAAPPAAPPPAGYPVLQGFPTPAGETAWSPVGTSPAPEPVDAGGVPAVRFRCAFADGAPDRNAWDLPVDLDLVEARGIRFRFRCDDPTPVAGFTFYFRSGAGWYSASFFDRWQDAGNGWTDIFIDKMATRKSGSPEGWSAVDAVRIAAWRAAEADTVFYLAQAGVMPGREDLVLVRAEAEVADPASGYARNVERALSRYGLAPRVVSDLDLQPGHLEVAAAAVLPYNVRMPEAATELLARYIEGGGHLVAFFAVPDALADPAGIELGRFEQEQRPGQFARIVPVGEPLPGMPAQVAQASWNIRRAAPAGERGRVAAQWRNAAGEATGPALVVTERAALLTHVLLNDDPANQRRLVLAMLSRFVPDALETAARTSVERAGRLGAYVAPAGLRAEARRLLDAGDYAAALDAARALHDETVRAWAADLNSVPGERRFVWRHEAAADAAGGHDRVARTLAENGFTDLLVNVSSGGAAHYPSERLPLAAGLEPGADPLARWLAACRAHELRFHAWRVCWKMGPDTPPAFRERMEAGGRTVVLRDGTREPWLCPTDPRNQELEAAAVAEMAARYPLAGVHLDYIRFPGENACFCEGCRQRFAEVLGQPLAPWPEAVDEPAVRTRWLDWRREQITNVVREVSRRVRAIDERIEVSAAVFPNWTTARDRIGQDWRTWVAEGRLDYVCPMNYTPYDPLFAAQVQHQLGWAAPGRVYPGIGLSTWPGEDRFLRYAAQVRLTRQAGTDGFAVFNLGPAELRHTVPLSGRGLTRVRR